MMEVNNWAGKMEENSWVDKREGNSWVDTREGNNWVGKMEGNNWGVNKMVENSMELDVCNVVAHKKALVSTNNLVMSRNNLVVNRQVVSSWVASSWVVSKRGENKLEENNLAHKLELDSLVDKLDNTPLLHNVLQPNRRLVILSQRDKHQSNTQPPMNHFEVPGHIHSCTVGCSYQVFVLLPSLVCDYSRMTHRSMMEHRRNHIRMMVADNLG
jgi:hypothetical protein